MNLSGIDFGSLDLGAISQEISRQQDIRRYDWKLNARPDQFPPDGKWRFWMILAGRGYGKTRTITEYLRMLAKAGKHRRIAILGATAADVRDVIVEGDSGILAVSPADFMPLYEPSKRQLTWPNGVLAKTYSADEPDRLRGPQHHAAIVDELAAYEYPEAFTQLKFGLRLGNDVKCVIATTPKPCYSVRELVKQAKEGNGRVVITRGSTYDNRANLAPEFFEEIIKQYEGTRLGRQELDGELLEDTPGALWNTVTLDRTRCKDSPPEMVRIVVAIDPSVTSSESADECGISVCGKGIDGEGYILEDLSGVMSPNDWARAAINAFHRWGADALIAETNNGGDLVGNTILAIDSGIPFRKVTASRGKVARAEPIAALFEQNRAHLVGHVGFEKLEEQFCAIATDGYTGKGSPDRADAAVWALSELMLGQGMAQMFPDFRPKPRERESIAACHIESGVNLPDWWPRWVSATHGGAGSAAHWWCREPNGRIHVYRELTVAEVTPEMFGMEIARLSQAEMQSIRMMPVWMSPKAFDKVQAKSVAVMVTEGISRVLGRQGAFLFVHDAKERNIQDPFERQKRMESRVFKMPDGFLNIQSLRAGNDQTGWDIVRELLRWKGDKPVKGERPDPELAHHLALTNTDDYRRYVDSFTGNTQEVLPVLKIADCCPVLIQAMGGAVRNPADDGELAKGNGAYVLQSLRIGALASREDRIMEPREEFVSKRMEGMDPKASAFSFVIAAERAEKQWSNTYEAEPLSFRRV